MSELRQDPTTREWVIIAPERARRPQQTKEKKEPDLLPDWDATCPFCMGNEAQTPDPTCMIPLSDEDSSWAVRVVPNRFAALTQEATIDGAGDGQFSRKMAGFGVHEVIIESPLHNVPMALMPYEQVEKVLAAYRQRYNALKGDHKLKFITIFKNHGADSGTSLAHPHSQLVATPIITPYYHRRFDKAHDYFADFGRCLYCDMLDNELKKDERIIIEDREFVVFEPFASRAPYETWIIPKTHRASFGLLAEKHVSELATILKDTLLCIYQKLDNPSFNLMIDTSTTYDEEDPYYHWHIRIVPRLSMVAGFEIGSGIYISSALPEESAEVLRECCVLLLKEGRVCSLPRGYVP